MSSIGIASLAVLCVGAEACWATLPYITEKGLGKCMMEDINTESLDVCNMSRHIAAQDPSSWRHSIRLPQLALNRRATTKGEG